MNSYFKKIQMGFALFLCIVTLTSCSKSAKNIDEANKPQKDETFAAIYIRPNHLKQTILADDHAVSSILPSQFGIGQLRNLPIDELFFLSNFVPDDSIQFSNVAVHLENSVVAELAEPFEIDHLLALWRQSYLEKGYVRDHPLKIKIDGKDCYSFPSGTFFPRKRKYGKLEFTTREGKRTDVKVNVGNEFRHRGFVVGNSKASGIFKFSGLSKKWLQNDKLQLELNASMLTTWYSGDEYFIATWEVRNPTSGVTSKPQYIEPRSYIYQTIEIPNTLEIIDEKGTEKIGILFDDLVDEKGQLEIIIKARVSGTFCGVGPESLSIFPQAFEYLFLDGKTAIVAESISRMERLIKDADSLKTTVRKHTNTDSDFSLAILLESRRRKLFSHLLEYYQLKFLDPFVGQGQHAFRCNVALASNKPLASISFHTDDNHELNDLEQELDEQLKHHVKDTGEHLLRTAAMANLTSLAFEGIPISRLNKTSEWEAIKAQLSKVGRDLISNITLNKNDRDVLISFKLPQNLEKPDQSLKQSLGLYDEVKSRKLYAWEKFSAFEDAIRRSLKKQNSNSFAIRRLAHIIAFNASREFEGYELRHQFYRKGIEWLLDEADRNPDSIDSISLAAFFVATKFGKADDHIHSVKQFRQDKRLLGRLEKYVSLEDAKHNNGPLDPIHLAKQMHELCIRRLTNSKGSSTIPEWLLKLQPPYLQSEIAMELDKSGKIQQAKKEWIEAGKLYDAYKDEILTFGLTSPTLSALANPKGNPATWSKVDYWLARCKLESLDEIRQARELALQGEKNDDQKKHRLAYQRFAESLTLIAGVAKKHPKEFALVAVDFIDIASAARSQAILSDAEVPDDILNIMQTISDSEKLPKRSTITGSYLLSQTSNFQK